MKLTGPARQGFVLAGKILLLFDLAPGFLKSADQRIDALQFWKGMPALAQKRKAVEESLGCPGHHVDIGFKLPRIVNEFRQTIVADVKAEIIRRDIFQIVRFVEDHGAVVGQ